MLNVNNGTIRAGTIRAVFVDDALPSTSSVNWAFIPGMSYSGAASHTDGFVDNYPGARQVER